MKSTTTYLLYSLMILLISLFAANAIAIVVAPADKSGSDPNIDKVQRLVNVPYSAVAKLPQVPAEKVVEYGLDSQQYYYHWPAQLDDNPEIDDGQRAPVIMIHGGCWLSAFDISHSIAQANGLAQAGHAVYSLEYRRSGETGGGWPITFNDSHHRSITREYHHSESNWALSRWPFSIVGCGRYSTPLGVVGSLRTEIQYRRLSCHC